MNFSSVFMQLIVISAPEQPTAQVRLLTVMPTTMVSVMRQKLQDVPMLQLVTTIATRLMKMEVVSLQMLVVCAVEQALTQTATASATQQKL
jgi:hypothetical protein